MNTGRTRFKKGHIPWIKGKHHSLKAKEKMSEARKGHKAGMKGKHHTVETKEKISKAKVGRLLTEAHKKNISEGNKGRKGYWKGKRHSKEYKTKMSQTQKIRCKSIEVREKMSEVMKGTMPTNLQNEGCAWSNIKRGWYDINGKKMFFRSKWEVNYALYLDFLIEQKQIKKWTYEKDVFIFEKIRLGTRSYRPDFKIYNNDLTIEYHEVKGFMTPKSKTKIKRMAKYYPDIKLLIIDKDVYGDIKSKLGKMLKFY